MPLVHIDSFNDGDIGSPIPGAYYYSPSYLDNPSQDKGGLFFYGGDGPGGGSAYFTSVGQDQNIDTGWAAGRNRFFSHRLVYNLGDFDSEPLYPDSMFFSVYIKIDRYPPDMAITLLQLDTYDRNIYSIAVLLLNNKIIVQRYNRINWNWYEDVVLGVWDYPLGSWFRFDLGLDWSNGWFNYGFFTDLDNPDWAAADYNQSTLNPIPSLKDYWFGNWLYDGTFTADFPENPFGLTDEEWDDYYNSDPEYYSNHPYYLLNYSPLPPSYGFGLGHFKRSITLHASIPSTINLNNENAHKSYSFAYVQVSSEPLQYPSGIPISGWYIGRVPGNIFAGGSGGGGGGGGSW